MGVLMFSREKRCTVCWISIETIESTFPDKRVTEQRTRMVLYCNSV